MIHSRFATFGIAFVVSTSLGCSLSSTPREETSASEAAATETIMVYDVESSRGVRCDIHTILRLSSREATDVRDPIEPGTVLFAHLENEATGDCSMLRLDPDPRDYLLVRDSEECGSIVYKSTETGESVGRAMTLTDHRRRTCSDRKPARIIVEETSHSGELRTLSSFDGTRPRPVS
jgi:hypothetical protein